MSLIREICRVLEDGPVSTMTRGQWKRYHESPVHGWLDPKGGFHWEEEHGHLIQRLPGFRKIQLMDDPFEYLHSQGWVRISPSVVDVGKQRLTKGQLGNVQDLFMKHRRRLARSLAVTAGGRSYLLPTQDFLTVRSPTELRRVGVATEYMPWGVKK